MTTRRLEAFGPWLTAATLLGLAACCFARLAARPDGLIVDDRLPSVDYANRGDPRPVGNDLVFLFLPHHESIARRIEQFGHLPRWDARGFGGRPLAGNPQAGMSYPPVWLAWWTRVPAALGWLTVGHLLWGGFGAYLLLRSMGSSPRAATAAAGTYQASPYLLAHVFEGHYPHVWAACWFPWAFWAFRGHREGRPRGLLLAPIVALVYLTGHPLEWLLLALALSAWAVLDSLLAWRSGGPGRSAGRLGAWLVILALSIGMAAVDLAPQWSARPWLRQNHEPGLEAGIPGRYHLGGLNVFQLLSPGALGGPADYFGDDNYWETLFSIGLVPLALAVIGASRHPDRRLARGWILLAVLAVMFAFGRSMGLYSLCYRFVPGASSLRVPARSLFLANLAGAVLTGLGVDVLGKRIVNLADWRRAARRVIVAGMVVIVALAVCASRKTAGPGRVPVAGPAKPPASGRTARAAANVLDDAGFLTATGVLVALLALGCRPIGVDRRRVVAGLIGLAGLIELGYGGYKLIQVSPADSFAGPDPVSAALERLEGSGRETGPVAVRLRPPPTIKARDTFYGDLPAAIHGIEKTNVDDAFQLDRPAALYEALYPIASRVRPMAERVMSPSAKAAWRRIRQAVLDRMSVSYVVSDRVETDPAWSVVADGSWGASRFVIQRNGSVMPRAYIVPRATVLPDHRDVVLSSFVDINPRQAVVMTADPLAGLDREHRQPFTEVEWTSIDPDRPALVATNQAPGLLVVADTWMPGWSATVDGRETPILPGNYAQRVIPLIEPGRHVIVMRYQAPGLSAGAVISVVSSVAWLMLIVRRLTARRRAGITIQDHTLKPHVPASTSRLTPCARAPALLPRRAGDAPRQ